MQVRLDGRSPQSNFKSGKLSRLEEGASQGREQPNLLVRRDKELPSLGPSHAQLSHEHSSRNHGHSHESHGQQLPPQHFAAKGPSPRAGIQRIQSPNKAIYLQNYSDQRPDLRNNQSLRQMLPLSLQVNPRQLQQSKKRNESEPIDEDCRSKEREKWQKEGGEIKRISSRQHVILQKYEDLACAQVTTPYQINVCDLELEDQRRSKQQSPNVVYDIKGQPPLQKTFHFGLMAASNANQLGSNRGFGGTLQNSRENAQVWSKAKQNGGANGQSNNTVNTAIPTIPILEDDQISLFQKYLKVVFQDICAQETGTSKSDIGYLSFLKYARSSKFSIYFARRLFIVLSNFNQEINTKNQAENPSRKIQASLSPNKYDTKAQNQPSPPISMQSKRVNITDFTRCISAIYGIIYNNDEKGRKAELLKGPRIQKNFKLEISSPTLVENSIQVEIIYRLLDETGRGFVRRNDLKIILDNIFHVTGAHSNEIVLLFQEIKELADAFNLHQKSNASQEFNGKQPPSSYQDFDLQKNSGMKIEQAQNIQDMINQAKICPSSGYKKITTSKVNQKGLKLDELISLKREVIILIIEGVFKHARGEELIKREALLSFTLKEIEFNTSIKATQQEQITQKFHTQLLFELILGYLRLYLPCAPYLQQLLQVQQLSYLQAANFARNAQSGFQKPAGMIMHAMSVHNSHESNNSDQSPSRLSNKHERAQFYSKTPLSKYGNDNQSSFGSLAEERLSQHNLSPSLRKSIQGEQNIGDYKAENSHITKKSRAKSLFFKGENKKPSVMKESSFHAMAEARVELKADENSPHVAVKSIFNKEGGIVRLESLEGNKATAKTVGYQLKNQTLIEASKKLSHTKKYTKQAETQQPAKQERIYIELLADSDEESKSQITPAVLKGGELLIAIKKERNQFYCTENPDEISDESRTDILDELEEQIHEDNPHAPIIAQTKSNFGILRPLDSSNPEIAVLKQDEEQLVASKQFSDHTIHSKYFHPQQKQLRPLVSRGLSLYRQRDSSNPFRNQNLNQRAKSSKQHPLLSNLGSNSSYSRGLEDVGSIGHVNLGTCQRSDFQGPNTIEGGFILQNIKQKPPHAVTTDQNHEFERAMEHLIKRRPQLNNFNSNSMYNKAGHSHKIILDPRQGLQVKNRPKQENALKDQGFTEEPLYKEVINSQFAKTSHIANEANSMVHVKQETLNHNSMKKEAKQQPTFSLLTIYLKLLSQREMECRQLNRQWTALYLKNSSKDETPVNDTTSNQSGVRTGFQSLNLIVKGTDLYGMRNGEEAQFRFIHNLLFCKVELSTDLSSLNKKAHQGRKSHGIQIPSLRNNNLNNQEILKKQQTAKNGGKLISNGDIAPCSGSQVHESYNVSMENTRDKIKCQLKVQVSQKHQRVMYFTDLMEAESLLDAIKKAQNFWDPGNLKRPKRYKLARTHAQPRKSGEAYEEVVLGQGSFGKVVLAKDRDTGKQVALKQINLAKLNELELEYIYQEVDMLRVMSEDPHPGVVQLIDEYGDQQNTLTVVMEYIHSGNSYKWLMETHKSAGFPEHVSQHVFQQIVESIRYVHQRGIIHRDIKLENILIYKEPNSKQWKTKLIDFGLSAIVLSDERRVDQIGSIAFLSPEIIRKDPHNQGTDIWSLGIVFYSLLTGRMPFITNSKSETLLNIQRQEINFKLPSWINTSPEAISLVGMMMTKDQRKRINAEGILRHHWFIKTYYNYQ